MPIQTPQPPAEIIFSYGDEGPGPTGPTGPQTPVLQPTWLSPKPVAVFQFVRSTPSTEWIIEHWLGRYPVVDVYIDMNGEKKLAIPLSITVDSVNKCTVHFSQPQSGLATVG